MSDTLQWFKFSPSNWMMGRIRKLGKSDQADFISLCCLYWKNGCTLTKEDAEFDVGGDVVSNMIAFRVLKVDGEHLRIKFLDEQLENIQETSQLRSKAAQHRWNTKQSKSNASAMQVHPSAMQSDADKIRGDKNRLDREKSAPDSVSWLAKMNAFVDSKSPQMEQLCMKQKTNPKALKKVIEEMEANYLSKSKLLPEGEPYYVLYNWLTNEPKFNRNGNGTPSTPVKQIVYDRPKPIE